MKTKKTELLNLCCLYAALILFFAAPAFAQNEQAAKTTILSSEAPSLRFEHIGLEEGMAQASANTIMQDSEGFLWIATQGGLHRYDGHEFKVYASTPFDTTSLSDSWVWAASEAKNGDLWVTTDNGGLNRMDRATGTFTHYLHNPDDSTSISGNGTFYALEARNGDLWVSTLGQGLNRMRAGEDGKFDHYRHDPADSNSISSDVLFWMNEDTGGTIWVGSNNGINRIDPETDTITRFLCDPESTRGYGGAANVLGQYLPPDKPGILWLATGNGLVRLNSETGTHERFLMAPNNDNDTSPLNFIHQVVPDPVDPNILWAAGPGTGVARFDMQTETFTAYRHNPKDPYSLSDNNVSSIFTDRSGTIWAGTTTEGLDAFNPGAVNFTHLHNDPENDRSLAPGIVWGIYEDKEGALWVGSDVGAAGNYLTRVDAATGAAKRYRHDDNDPASIQPGNVRSFAEDSAGNFWVAGSGGLGLLDHKTGRVTHFLHPADTPEDRKRNAIFALQPTLADSNVLWVGSVGGLDRFNTNTGRYSPVAFDSAGNGGSPPVASVYEDAEATLWAGSNEGLFRVPAGGHPTLASAYDPQDTTTISQNNIMSITGRAEEPGILWLATQSGGLNRFDTKTGIATHYTTANGLPSNAVYAVLSNSGTLWISTNKGISNFDPDTEIFRNYGLDDGLMALEYNQNAYAKGKNGVLYFGSGKGVTAFVPERLHINDIPPQVVLSDFKLNNKTVLIGPDSPLKQPLSEAKSIMLNYDQNEFTFDFVALHYANAAKNSYAYQLEGFDADWIEAGNKRSATYTNLPAGDYTFRVKAANADGIWNEKGTSIKLSVLPPWWRTWWAYALFAGAFCAGVFGVDRVQRRRLSKKENERTALREAELRAEAENKRRADTEQLSTIGRAITSTLSVSKIIETVYENVNALMDAAIFGVGIYNKEKHCLDFPATKEKGKMLPPYINRLDDENRLAVWCFKNREEIAISDFANEHKKYINSYKPPLEGKDATSILYLPLLQQDRVIGVITTQSFKKGAYTVYHLNLLRNLATYVAIALDNAAAYRRLNATLSELKNMQQQLVQQEKLASLGQLTAGIAHEIKNPLNFVNNFSDVSIELIEEVKKELSAVSNQLSKFRSQESKSGSQKPSSAGDNPLEKEENIKLGSYYKSSSAEGIPIEKRNARIPDGTEPGDVNKQTRVSDINYTLEILSDIEANLRKIHEHGSRADSIVKSMLQHSRGGNEKMEPTELNALIKEYVNLAFHGMRASKNPINVEIDLQLDERVGKVPLIAEDFSRVIVNLCNNAFDAMREKAKVKGEAANEYLPKLTVKNICVNNQVNVEVIDNGPGIPEKIKEKIMQPFFTTKKGKDGTGLGLSIANDIVKAHGGSLSIKSTEGVSTTFLITLPTRL